MSRLSRTLVIVSLTLGLAGIVATTEGFGGQGPWLPLGLTLLVLAAVIVTPVIHVTLYEHEFHDGRERGWDARGFHQGEPRRHERDHRWYDEP